MLQRIESIKNIGLFKDVSPARHAFKKATLIYADNGRGKSTAASVFRSVGNGDASVLVSRATIDSPDAPSVVLQFGSGHRVNFAAGAWSEIRSEFVVFDNDFADRNVHSGGVVSTSHRKNLLEFALGEKSVSARKLVEESTAKASASAALLKQHTSAVSGFHDGMPLSTFEALAESETIDEEIDAQTRKVVAATNSEVILKKPLPAEVPAPAFDIPALFGILATSLEDIHADAERLVREHTAKSTKEGFESWLSEGQQFQQQDDCPYCGQSTSGIELIAAYRTHFNKAYSALKSKVRVLESGIEKRTSEDVVVEIAKAVATANQIILGWSDNKKAEPAKFDEERSKELLHEIRELLEPLAKRKASSPPEAVGDAPVQAQVEALWNAFLLLVAEANKAIAAAKFLIEAFKKSLAAVNVQTEKAALRTLQLRKARYSEEVVKLFSLLKAERVKSATLEEKKNEARKNLNALMEETLGKYQGEINTILGKFGASFTIESLNANYRGGSPRSEYFLHLRGKAIPVEGGTPAFATALSEGDKRTLAFAFFVASALQDPKRGEKIVVIDDPMCSFDLNRKEQTRVVLRRLFGESLQLVILAHDIYFLKEMKATLGKDGANEVACLQVKFSGGGYSDFDAMDFEEECEGPYYKHHRYLNQFFAATAGADATEAAKAIRPFLEGYLHRRFPGHVPTGVMFGQVISFIKDADPAHPVSGAKALVDCLSELNEYAGKFHHDTNPGKVESVTIVESELRSYVDRALKVAYTGMAS